MDWFGLSINGTVQPNVQLSFAIVNDLVESATMLRTEDWSIARDSTLEYGELSSGGSRIKATLEPTSRATIPLYIKTSQ